MPVKNIHDSTAIEKALDILRTFIPYNNAISTTELSRKLGLHKATVSRILLTLANKGFLQQDPDTKKFMLGPTSLKLGNAVSQALRSNLVPIAKPYVDGLREEIDETVTFEVFSGMHSVMAYVAMGSKPVRVAAEVGKTLPSHAAAGSKCILAFSPPEIRARCVEGVLMSYTPNTIVDHDAFQDHLLEVRRKGYAADIGEIESEVNAIAVPVFDSESRAVGALVVVGPESRIPGAEPDELISRLKDTAGEISAQLFCEGVLPLANP